MNNFQSNFSAGQGAATMQRRGALMPGAPGGMQGGSPPRRGAMNQSANRFGGQPILEDDFLSRGDDAGKSQNSLGAFRSTGGGAQNQYNSNQQQRSGGFAKRPPTGGPNVQVSGFDVGNPYGVPGGRPATGGLQGFNSGGGNAAGPQNFSRTLGGGGQFRTGSAMTNQGMNRQGGMGFGGPRGGAGGAYGTSGGDSGMNRYNSQQSLAYSQHSYGEQSAYGGGPGGMLRRPSSNKGFGRTMASNRGGLGIGGGMGMSMGGGMAGGMNSRFGQSFKPVRQSQPQMPQYQVDHSLMRNDQFVELLQYMGQTINQSCIQNQLPKPSDFFSDFDAYSLREFEDWELQLMFDLQPEVATDFVQTVDQEQQQVRTVPIGLLITYLQQQFVPGLSLNDIAAKSASTWSTRKSKISRVDLDGFVAFAEALLNQSSQNSYRDAFEQIGSKYTSDFNGAILSNDAMTECMKELQPEAPIKQIRSFLNYITLGRNTQVINVIHFVRALQTLSPDSLTRARSPSPDMGGMRDSIDRITGFSGVLESNNLEDMLNKIPEKPQSQQLNPLVIQLAEHLQAQGGVAQIDAAFKTVEQKEIKRGIGQTQQAKCVPKDEFVSWLSGLQNPATQQRLFVGAQVNVFTDLYIAEQIQVAAPAGPQHTGSAANIPLHASAIQENTPEEEQDPPEDAGVGRGEEIKVEENPIQQPEDAEENKQPAGSALGIKKSDTEFERAASDKEESKTGSVGETKPKATEEVKVEAPKPKEEEKKEEAKTAVAAPAGPAEEQKEGGQFEFYEGGASNEWINLDQFKNDLIESTKLTREKARALILEVFERIKKWYVKTSKQIKLMFRNQDKKRKKFVSSKDLGIVLRKVMRPFNLTSDHVNAIISVIGSTDDNSLYYERFCSAFFGWVNQKVVDQSAPLFELIQQIQMYANGQSLVKLLMKVNEKQEQTDPNYPFEVPFKTFILKIQRHHGRQIQINPQQQQQLEDLIVPNKASGNADLVRLQELMGIPEEEIIDVEGNIYRQLAKRLQLNSMTGFDQVRKAVLQGQRQRKTIPKMQLFQNWDMLMQFQDDLEANNFQGMLQDHDEGMSDQVNVEKFLGKIEHEMNKFILIQRFYLRIDKAKPDDEEVTEYMGQFGLDAARNEMTAADFKALLVDMDLVGSKDENWIYFQEDFDPEVSGYVAGEKFEEDSKELLPHIEAVVRFVLEMIDYYCHNQPTGKVSVKEELSMIQRTNQVHLLSGQAQSAEKSSLHWLHTFDFQRWFQTQVVPFWFGGQYRAPYDREVVNVFTAYMSRGGSQKDLIYLPQLLQIYSRDFKDEEVEQELSQESLPILVNYCCKILDREKKYPAELFPVFPMKDDEFCALLNRHPFSADIDCDFPTDLEKVVKYAEEIRENRYQVDVDKFVNLVKAHIDKLTMRKKEFLTIRKQLDQRGDTIENALTQIKGGNDKLDQLGIELVDLAQLCKMTEVKLDVEGQLVPIMDTFDKNMYGEVAATDFISAFQKAHMGLFEDNGGSEQDLDLQETVNAKRYFLGADEAIKEICAEIEERGLSDFGSFLKGNDLFHEGKISDKSFFQILRKVFDEVLGEGDILDVLRYFDAQQTGTILIRDVQKTFNNLISTRANQIRLVSWVDACVEENIVEPVSPRSKAAKGQSGASSDASKPEQYAKQMLIDIHCGGLIKAQDDLQSWFEQFGVFRPHELNKNEFVIALDRLGVESDLKDKEQVYQFMLRRVAIKQDRLHELQKQPTFSQSLKVDDLVLCLDEDMPAGERMGLQDRLLKLIALAITDLKIPVLDLLQARQVEGEPGYIDSNTFAINVLENDFKLKNRLTRNMISVVASRYEEEGQPSILYRGFLADLEVLEQANPAQIRIFKTQKEINFFQQTGAGGDDIDAESYKKNRILIDPLKEPVLVAKSIKNTFYTMSEDQSMEQSFNNNFMEGTNRQPLQTPKPYLDPSMHAKVDELILETRRLGVSVEGYFQRFGKFSTQDGVRKIDNKQFRDAIGNLEGFEWAKERPNLMDQLFDAILIAFENFYGQEKEQQRAMMNYTQTIVSEDPHGEVKAQSERGAETRLTLEQIGQIVFHNSTVSLDSLEAEALSQLHSVMFEKNLLGKLHDMVTFMNFQKDSSCTVDQFKSLILDTMKLRSHLNPSHFELLIQRYRQDAYDLAKVQRNELADRNADRLEVIKKGFSEAGKQRIQLLGCYLDLGYQQRKLGLRDQWAAEVAEDITKAHQIKLIEEQQLPMTDHDTANQMHGHFVRMCQVHPDQFTFTDYSYMLTSQQLWDGQVHSRTCLEDFFKLCAREEVSDYFRPNSIDTSMLTLPQYVPTKQFTRAFEFLARKPLSYMYQEVLDKFYVISKRQNLHISGPTIMHMFDCEDLEETGTVFLEDFVQLIQELAGRRKFKDHKLITDHINDHDLRFLATKYMARDGSQRVDYLQFLDDYDTIENQGLGSGQNQLSQTEAAQGPRDTTIRNISGQAGTWRIKSLSEVSPPESQALYEKVGKYLYKKGLMEPLCLSLVNANQERDGFLDRHSISEVMARNGMKVSQKQLTLLTQVLIMNHRQDYCYLEMIALLSSERMMHQVMKENQIELGGAQDVPKKIDMSLLVLSDSLRDQLELKYAQMTATVAQLTRNTMQIRDQELFQILKDCQVACDMTDVDVLEQYLTFQRNKENNTISFRVFLDQFRIQPHTSDLLADIGRQLAEKKVVLEEVTSKKRFTFQELSDLLKRVGVKVNHDKQQVMQCLFEQMSERQEELSRAKLFMCLGKQFSTAGRPAQASRKKQTTLPEPPYAANALLSFLVHSRINLRQLFGAQGQKRMHAQQLQDLCDQRNYQLTKGDFDVICRFFAPKSDAAQGQASHRSGQMSSARDSARRATLSRRGTSKQREEAPDTLDLVKIIVYCRRIDANYGKEGAAEGGPGGNARSKAIFTSFPQRIKMIVKRFSDYILDNQVPKEVLFAELDRNQNDRIDLDELKRFVEQNQFLEGMASEDVEKLYSFLDTNQDGFISVNEFCLLIEGVKLSTQARMASFSFEFDAQLKTEIEALFNRLDTDRSGHLTADEFAQMLRPTDKKGTVTLTRAYEIVRKIDSDGDSRISRQEFVQYLMPIQKRQILDFEDQMEDLRRLFKEQIAEGVTSDPTENQNDILNKNQFITKDALKSLIVKAGHRSVTQAELDAVFTEMDADQNGTIDVDEFIAFVQMADRVRTKSTLSRDAVFNIRKARLKLNSLDLLEMFVRMPLSFLPSFSMHELESRKQHLPIHAIQFHFDHNKMAYTGLDKVKDRRTKLDQQGLYVAKHKPSVAFELALTGEAIGVPLIQRLKPEYELPHFEVRLVLFDTRQKVYLSNFYILGAEAVRRPLPKGKQAADAQISADLRFEQGLRELYLTSDLSGNQDASLVAEFVIYSRNTMASEASDRTDKGNQVTVAWASVALTELASKVKHKLDLKGGSPFQEQEISTEEDAEKPKQGKSILKKIFGGKDEAQKVPRYITLEAKPFAKLPEPDQFDLSSLPSARQSCLIAKALLSPAVAFRDHCFQALTKHEQEMTQPHLDLLMTQFPKIYNNPDCATALAQCWQALPQPQAQQLSRLGQAEAHMAKLYDFVRQIYAVMYDPKVKLDQVYPTRSSPLNSLVYRHRQIALKTAMMGDNLQFMNKLRQTEVAAAEQAAQAEGPAAVAIEEPAEGQTMFMEDYVPFNMGEICGNVDGFDGDDAIAGLSVDKERIVNEMERKYAADGLYI